MCLIDQVKILSIWLKLFVNVKVDYEKIFMGQVNYICERIGFIFIIFIIYLVIMLFKKRVRRDDVVMGGVLLLILLIEVYNGKKG